MRVDIPTPATRSGSSSARSPAPSPESGTTYADEEDIHVVDAPAGDVEPDVVVDGTAAALDLWLWHRGDDAEVSVAGDEATYARFRAVVDTPID